MGSEMCIRDRSSAGDIAEVPIHDPGPIRHMREDAVGPIVRVQPCLLYTSDAADERSSVDLGGRRIIKKKNN